MRRLIIVIVLAAISPFTALTYLLGQFAFAAFRAWREWRAAQFDPGFHDIVVTDEQREEFEGRMQENEFAVANRGQTVLFIDPLDPPEEEIVFDPSTGPYYRYPTRTYI